MQNILFFALHANIPLALCLFPLRSIHDVAQLTYPKTLANNFRRCTHYSDFFSTKWLCFQSLWSLYWCLMCCRDVRVCISSLCCLPSVTIFLILLLEGILILSRPFLSYLDFACRQFLILLLVRAHLVLPHYIALLSTLCWLMGDALMPSFQQIPSHQL